jgi:hypothetical protein
MFVWHGWLRKRTEATPALRASLRNPVGVVARERRCQVLSWRVAVPSRVAAVPHSGTSAYARSVATRRIRVGFLYRGLKPTSTNLTVAPRRLRGSRGNWRLRQRIKIFDALPYWKRLRH